MTAGADLGAAAGAPAGAAGARTGTALGAADAGAVGPGALQGRVALVTGAGRRTGRGVALALAARGARVAVHYRSRPHEAHAVVGEIERLHGPALAVQAELTDPAAVAAMVAQVTERFGPVEILVNCAGTFLVKNVAEVTPAEWERAVTGNLTTTFLTCRAVLPAMAARGYGRIVNFADAGADHLRAAPNLTPYLAAKTGVLILTKSLAAHYAGRGVTVNAVSPGIVDNSVTKPPAGEAAIPAGRYATIADVAGAVCFLVSAAASYVTGANLKVSGGWHA